MAPQIRLVKDSHLTYAYPIDNIDDSLPTCTTSRYGAIAARQPQAPPAPPSLPSSPPRMPLVPNQARSHVNANVIATAGAGGKYYDPAHGSSRKGSRAQQLQQGENQAFGAGVGGGKAQGGRRGSSVSSAQGWGGAARERGWVNAEAVGAGAGAGEATRGSWRKRGGRRAGRRMGGGGGGALDSVGDGSGASLLA